MACLQHGCRCQAKQLQHEAEQQARLETKAGRADARRLLGEAGDVFAAEELRVNKEALSSAVHCYRGAHRFEAAARVCTERCRPPR